MPFIKITTLRNVPETAKIMRDLERELYEYELEGQPLMPKNMATCMWQTSDCMVHGLETHYEFDQFQIEIPVFVDLYVNTIFTDRQLGKIMHIIADKLSEGTGVNRKFVFIHVHLGKPGHVFINGEVWHGSEGGYELNT